MAPGVEVKTALFWRHRDRRVESTPPRERSKTAHRHHAAHFAPCCAFWYSPPGQDMRERDHVVLRVAAAHAERVQFHQLARVILVDAFEFALGAGLPGAVFCQLSR